MLNYAFNELNLYRIQLDVLSYNERAIRVYENLGFRREGTFREFGERDRERYDLYLYGLLIDEYAQNIVVVPFSLQDLEFHTRPQNKTQGE
jgi:RimJ/RimL family protein N-acetyltransferase